MTRARSREYAGQADYVRRYLWYLRQKLEDYREALRYIQDERKKLRRESLMPRPAGDLRIDDALRDADYCYITTTGRVTGNPHTIEIWFGIEASTLYVLAGGRHDADFVKNLRKRSEVSVRIGRRTFDAAARVVALPREDAVARRLLLDKYAPRYSGDLDDWGRDALPVAFDLRGRPENQEPRTKNLTPA